MSESDDWREKYLNSLDELDRLTEKLDHRQALLRKAVVRVIVAASGQTPELDSQLSNLKASLNDEAKLLDALEGVDQAIADLDSLEEQLDERGLRQELSRLFKELQLHSGAEADETYEALQRDMQDHTHSWPLLFDRLRVLIRGWWGEQGSGDQPITDDLRPEKLGAAIVEDPLSLFVDRARSVLLDLVINIEPAECVRDLARNIQDLLQNSLSAQSFIPALESVRDLILQTYLQSDQQHRDYLQQMHQQLEEIVGGIGNIQLGMEGEAGQIRLVESTLCGEVSAMAETLRNSSDLNQLKTNINHHLKVLQGALSDQPLTSHLDRMSSQLESLQSQLSEMEKNSRQFREELEIQKAKALTDALTGLPNREAYNQRAYEEKQRQLRFSQNLCLVVCDIDHFKRINDSFGHQAGDRVLTVLAKTLKQRLRAVDFIARYGGEEFVILLPDTPIDGAWHLMEQIRIAIAAAPLRFQQKPMQVSLSMGVVEVKSDESIDQAFLRGDKLLYVAKAQGRNRCVREASESL